MDEAVDHIGWCYIRIVSRTWGDMTEHASELVKAILAR